MAWVGSRAGMTAGSRTALDGWRMAWDISTAPGQTQCGPGRIDTWNEAGTPQVTISGEMDQQYVEREVKAFLKGHSGQGELF